MKYPEGPTDEAKIDSTEYNAELIGVNDFGSVYIHGPFGDKNSSVKIAYVIGMHPLESKSKLKIQIVILRVVLKASF